MRGGGGCGCGPFARGCCDGEAAGGGEWVSEKPACRWLFGLRLRGSGRAAAAEALPRARLRGSSLYSFLPGPKAGIGFSSPATSGVACIRAPDFPAAGAQRWGIGFRLLFCFPARSPRAGSFPRSWREIRRDRSVGSLCRRLKGKEPRAPRGLARGRPESWRRAAAPDRVRVRERKKRDGVGWDQTTGLQNCLGFEVAKDC